MDGYTEVFAWGGDHFGQLGLGGKVLNKTYPSPRFCSFNILIKEISCGEEHSGFISSTGHVYTMGSNTDGRLGVGSRSIRQSASPCLVEELANVVITKISCGWAHTAVISESGEAFSWGLGEFGALGNGLNETRYSPSLMNIHKLQAIEVSCGSRHTGLILKDSIKKMLFMCGGGEAGQLGTGRREKELTPAFIDLIEEPEQVSCGVFHSGVVTVKGNLFMMGGNSFGQLGLGNKKSQNRPEKVSHLEGVNVRKVRCSNFSAAVTDKGVLYIWGSGVFGEYLLPYKWTLRDPVLDFAIGAGFGIALDSSGSVHVWGGNSNGELGLEDYEARASPSLVPSLRGKSLNKISCGGNFCIGLGSDIQARKTPEKKKREEEKFEQVDRLSFEVKQTYKTYEELKRNFEILLEKYEIEKRSNSKYIEEIGRDVNRYKQEIDRLRGQVELDDREIRELTSCLNDVKRSNHELCLEANNTRDEMILYKKQLEDLRSHNWADLKKLEEDREKEIFALQEKLGQEINKRKHAENELEKTDSIIKEYEKNIKSCQNDLNDLGFEFEENSKKGEIERKRLHGQIELYVKDLSESFKKNEILTAEKEKLQSVMKGEIEKYFKENKELKFQAELLKEQIQSKTFENSEILKNLKALNSEKMVSENTLNSEIERINYEKQKKIELLLNENEKLKADNSELIKSLEHGKKQLERLNFELERLENENSQLSSKIEYLVVDKEKLSASLSAEIEHLTGQKLELLEKYDQVYIEKERKVHSLSVEIEKNFSEYSDLKQKIDKFSNENDRLQSKVSSLTDENRLLRSQNDQILQDSKSLSSQAESLSAENKRFSLMIQETSKETSDLLSKLQNLSREKDDIFSRCSALIREKEDLSFKLSQLNKEKEHFSRDHSDLIQKHTALAKEKEDTSLKLNSLIKEKEDSIQNLKVLLRDRENTIKSHESSLAALKNETKDLITEQEVNRSEIQELHIVIDHARQEKVQISSLLSEELSFKSSEIQKWMTQSSMKEKEIAFIKQILSEREAEGNRNQEMIKRLLDENNVIKRQMEDIRKEIENSHFKLNEKEYLIHSIKDAAGNWEGKYNESLKENSYLRAQVHELEVKNRQLFENLERELAQRAKDYKERTMNILTMPLRSSSPCIRPPTPDGRAYSRFQTPMMSVDKADDLGNTAARLLSTLEASPRKGVTPTKEDLKGKIANLMESRNRIENELREIDYD